MQKKITIVFFFCILFLSGCIDNGKAPLQEIKNSDQKNVILIIVDSLTGELIETGLEDHDFPAIEYLKNRGQFFNNLVAPFPSMSVTIESTLLTGEMPDKHEIPGLTWYKSSEKRLVDYGSSFETVRKLGIRQTYQDIFYNLNNVHLSKNVTTIHEELAKINISSGSLNLLVYRGNEDQLIQSPYLLKKIGAPSVDIVTKGPEFFSLGVFHKPEQLKNELLPDTLIQKAGLSDFYAGEVLTKLLNTSNQPQFLMVFLPDMDKQTHKNGPLHSKALKKVDHELQKILDVYENWDQALAENIIILMGDHGQNAIVKKESELKIDLHNVFSKYSIAPFGDDQTNGEMSIANNHRMVYVYPMASKLSKFDLVKEAIKDSRICLAAYLDGEWIKVWRPNIKDPVLFKKGGKWKDIYNQSWTIKGDAQLLNIQTDGQEDFLTYGDYPDVLNQLYSAAVSQPSSIILSAEPGYSFYSETAPIHAGGGEHGGIHKTDTLAAMIIAGTDKRPEYLRIKDLKPFILTLF